MRHVLEAILSTAGLWSLAFIVPTWKLVVKWDKMKERDLKSQHKNRTL